MDLGLLLLLIGLASIAVFIVAIIAKGGAPSRPAQRAVGGVVGGVVGHCINQKTLEDQVRVHLAECLNPPAEPVWIPVCCEAIRLATSGEMHEMVPLLEGMGYGGEAQAPVRAVFAEFQLTGWLYSAIDFSADPMPESTSRE